MKKVLFVATVVKIHIMVFHIPYLEWFRKNGYEVHVCAKNDFENKAECIIPFCNQYYDLPFERSPFKLNNLKIYKELKQIIDTNNYDIIHCHTPMGGALTRLAARKARSRGTKVLYTAHGFHFFKGAPIANWLMYYPTEKWLSRYTDVLITLNKEDYDKAKKFNAKKVEYVPGVGVNIKKFSEVYIDINLKRKEIGLTEDSFMILSVGELNKNKNQEVVIRALARLKNKKINYVLCGQGPLEDYLIELGKELGICEQVHFLGFRYDIPELCKAADLFAFPSYREGLSLSLMEAMASGLPVICSNIRGNTDLIEDGKGGYLVKPDDIDGFVTAINNVNQNDKLCENFIKNNTNKIIFYSVEKVKEKMAYLYGELIQ